MIYIYIYRFIYHLLKHKNWIAHGFTKTCLVLREIYYRELGQKHDLFVEKTGVWLREALHLTP